MTLPPNRSYRPSANLDWFVRCRDMTCRFPGCKKPADVCDLDHTIAYPVGPTCASNLKCLCRKHHLLKTFWAGPNGWRDRQLPDGTVIWTDPDGQTHVTRPGSYELFPKLCEPTAPVTVPRRCARSTGQRADHAASPSHPRRGPGQTDSRRALLQRKLRRRTTTQPHDRPHSRQTAACTVLGERQPRAGTPTARRTYSGGTSNASDRRGSRIRTSSGIGGLVVQREMTVELRVHLADVDLDVQAGARDVGLDGSGLRRRPTVGRWCGPRAWAPTTACRAHAAR